MDVKLGVLLMMAVMGVLLVVVMLGETLSSDWTTVAQGVAPAIVLIAFVGLVGAFALSRR